jgi:hypothetical protein
MQWAARNFDRMRELERIKWVLISARLKSYFRVKGSANIFKRY